VLKKINVSCFFFGALNPKLFLDFSQHVRLLRYSSINIPETLKNSLSSLGKRPQGILRNQSTRGFFGFESGF
jgi:hypothetical protein